MNTTLSERIQEIIQAGHSQVELAEAAGVTKGTANQWMDGKIKSIKLEYAQGIETLTGFNANWIVTGKGEKKAEEVIDRASLNNSVIYADEGNTVEVKRVKLRLSAGINRIQIDHCIEVGEPITYSRDWLQRRGLFPEDLLAVEVTGESMAPGMLPGDVVVINTADKVAKHGKVFAVNFDGQPVIKRLMYKNRNWFLYSDNADQESFPPHHCRSGECVPIGLVIDLRREF